MIARAFFYLPSDRSIMVCIEYSRLFYEAYTWLVSTNYLLINVFNLGFIFLIMNHSM